jgi:hypothetical protein
MKKYCSGLHARFEIFRVHEDSKMGSVKCPAKKQSSIFFFFLFSFFFFLFLIFGSNNIVANQASMTQISCQ